MIIRFGYVSHAITLWEASPAKTLTFTRYKAMEEKERMERLLIATSLNLKNTIRMLHYNIAHDIEVYRFSSSLVPLATHPEVRWDFVTPFKKEWKEIGTLVKKHKLRSSFHPSAFTLFTSPRQEVTANAIIDMDYHYRMFEAMGLEKEGTLNIHIGGAYGDKETTILRFHENLKQLPSHIKKVMTLENDDKTYNSDETLLACQKEDIPFAFDYHHHLANTGEEPLEDLLPKAFKTWERKGIRPKIHISSPRSEQAYRAHADYIDADYIAPLLKILREINVNVDLMIEAKLKDQALLALVDELSKIRGVKRIRGAALQWK